jgi:hypothetical protein
MFVRRYGSGLRDITVDGQGRGGVSRAGLRRTGVGG